MANDRLPSDVKDFVHGCIDSVEQLEVLLLLRDHSDRKWSAAEVSQELRSAPESVEKRMKGLHIKRLLTLDAASPGRYQYAPSHGMREVIDQVAVEYRTRRFSVIELIFSKPNDALRVFSDAFKLKKDGSEDG